MSYDRIQQWLGWPDRDQAFGPSGAGANAFVEFAQKKIQGALNSEHRGTEVNIGVIAADPNSDSSEAPLALLCEFPRAANDEVLDLVHKLAWNLSKTALLITLEPHRLMAWTCQLDPTQGVQRHVCELPEIEHFQPSKSPIQRQVRDLLHWVNLITNRAQHVHPKQFPADGRADALLLKNLRYVRAELLARGLAQDHCHDLLARVIFTQFLFHRKDSDGHAFFSPAKMRRLQEDDTLSRYHESLASLLTHKTDTYALFRWMDERFNGDLFPGKNGEDEDDREAAWRAEKKAVSAEEHLALLAGLVSGTLDVKDKQHTLWPHYSFDTIPIEFISSVYEEFLTAEERGNDKAYYTPSHLVDYVLDAVLPWGSNKWNVRILDPCCGSGIFLVKAFQRLIHRWRRAKGREPLVSDLRPILERNLVGVDKNPEAVRVACFSLYLAMADAIEPKHYITRDNTKVFPRLRGTRLLRQDFFDEDTSANTESFDYVLGNAPWGDGSIFPDKLPGEEKADYRKRIKILPPTPGQKWAKANGWPVANNDIGPLFLAKAASLVNSNGFVAMVNTASLLYWRDGQATDLRKKLFTSFSFDEVTNLSALRRDLFPQAIGPSCIVVFGAAKPDPQKLLHYYTPKPARSEPSQRGKPQASRGFSVEPHDVKTLTHAEAAEDSMVWPVLMLGSSRDALLLRRLSAFPKLRQLEAEGVVATREGVVFGQRDKTPREKALRGLPLLQLPKFPSATSLELDASLLPTWEDPRVSARDSEDFSAFKLPQLIIKQGFETADSRFKAALVRSDASDWGVICSQAYLTVSSMGASLALLRSACIIYNSSFATYFLWNTSSRLGHYRTEVLAKELLEVPISNVSLVSMSGSSTEIDATVRQTFNLTAADWTLIEDFLEYTLPDVLRTTGVRARLQTQRKDNCGIKEPELTEYAKTFSRVVKGTFGKDRSVAATVFTDPEGRRLPVRMLTIHLDSLEKTGVHSESIEADGLLDQLAKFHTDQLKQKPRDATGNGLGFQRVAYFFHPSRESGRRVMNLTIVKPDERRYWTRSMAMRDADQLAVSIVKAAGGAKK